MDLPDRGGPNISSECEPAAAISKARLVSGWPRTSLRSALGIVGAGWAPEMKGSNLLA
jgi:hypothetical protein